MEILIIIFLILLNGIFSMSEIALVSVRKFKLESAAKRGSKNAARALKLAGNPNTFLSTVQIGITLIGILTGVFSGDTLTGPVKSFIASVPALQPYAQTISVSLVVIVITFFSIVFGELIPKRIGLMFPEAIAASVATPMTWLSIITKPFIWLLTQTNDLFLKIFGLKNTKEGVISEEEIKAMVQESAEGGVIREIEQDIVHRVFALGDRKVSDLMTHRRDLVYFEIHDDFKTIKQRAQIEAHSVYPVIRKTIDQFIGIVSLKDIFPKDIRNADFMLQTYLKQPLMVPENTPAYKVLEKFRKERMHYAFVLDEYGAVQGMVSMDDILDALIGDVTEYNQSEYQIVQRDDKSWLADGAFPFFEFLNYFGLSSGQATSGDYNTLAGLVLEQLSHIPKSGEKIQWNQFTFEVVDMDGFKIDKLLITLTA